MFQPRSQTNNKAQSFEKKEDVNLPAIPWWHQMIFPGLFNNQPPSELFILAQPETAIALFAVLSKGSVTCILLLLLAQMDCLDLHIDRTVYTV